MRRRSVIRREISCNRYRLCSGSFSPSSRGGFFKDLWSGFARLSYYAQKSSNCPDWRYNVSWFARLDRSCSLIGTSRHHLQRKVTENCKNVFRMLRIVLEIICQITVNLGYIGWLGTFHLIYPKSDISNEMLIIWAKQFVWYIRNSVHSYTLHLSIRVLLNNVKIKWFIKITQLSAARHSIEPPPRHQLRMTVEPGFIRGFQAAQ